MSVAYAFYTSMIYMSIAYDNIHKYIHTSSIGIQQQIFQLPLPVIALKLQGP